MVSGTRAAWRTAAIAATAVLLVGCSGQSASTATPTGASPASTATPISSTDGTSADTPTSTAESPEIPDQLVAAAAEAFATKFAQYDRAALDLVEPGTIAHTYAEGSILLQEGGQLATSTKPAARKVATGWNVGNNVVLSDFRLSDAGKITSLSRNGIAIDKLVAPGDGTEYILAPTAGYQTWTGSIATKVHSFRIWDNNVAILMTATNNSSGKAQVFFSNYAVGGKQVNEAAGSDQTLPSVTRTTGSFFQNTVGGGKAYGTILASDDGGGSQDVVIDVPALG